MNLNIKSLFNFNKKTILITGSSGQIGSSIVKLFLDLGSKVYGFDKTKGTIKHNSYKFIKLIFLSLNLFIIINIKHIQINNVPNIPCSVNNSYQI